MKLTIDHIRLMRPGESRWCLAKRVDTLRTACWRVAKESEAHQGFDLKVVGERVLVTRRPVTVCSECEGSGVRLCGGEP